MGLAADAVSPIFLHIITPLRTLFDPSSTFLRLFSDKNR